MTRLVRGADGRMWTLRTRVEWTNPATVDDFEHDVATGYGSGVFMLFLLVSLVVVLVAWTPARVVIPWWLLLLLIAIVLFLPVRWLVRRPWRVVANTQGTPEEHPAEHWVGTVRGVYRIRQEAAKVARDIEVYSAPDAQGPLHPVD